MIENTRSAKLHLKYRLLFLAFLALLCAACLIVTQNAWANQQQCFTGSIAGGATQFCDVTIPADSERVIVAVYCLGCAAAGDVNNTFLEPYMTNGTTLLGRLSQITLAADVVASSPAVACNSGGTAGWCDRLEFRLDGAEKVRIQQLNGNAAAKTFTIDVMSTGGRVEISQDAPGNKPVSVQNFPATQPVSGTTAISNFPSDQLVHCGSNDCISGHTGGGGSSDASNATIEGGFNNLHGDLWVLVGVIAGAALLPSLLALFFGTGSSQ